MTAPTARVVFTDRTDGDFSGDREAAAWRSVTPFPCTWLRQVHGAAVVTVDAPGSMAGSNADGAVTTVIGAALGIRAADCATVAFVGDGAVGVAHAGWRGLLAGVLEATIDVMIDVGGSTPTARLGPCIHPECYEFGEADLAVVRRRFGPSVVGRTAAGSMALDLPGAVAVALDRRGIALDRTPSVCTACRPQYYSHRARAETGRHALVGWLEP